MGRTPLGTLIRLVRRLADVADGDDESDGHFLQRFVRCRDGDAFAVLVQRHGRLVWSVCRRVLPCDADAEDAFQATFLALSRHAAGIRVGEALASWLYRVAHRVARKAMQERDARQAGERAAERPMHAPPHDDLAHRELRAVVDEELRRLPEKLQAPFLLCCLEGKSKAEAARQLGWKLGTVSGRLAEARKRMRRSLLRRGVTPAAAATAIAVESSLAPAAALTANTVQTAVGAAVASASARIALLAEGACEAMSARKAIVVIVLLVGGLLAGGGIWISRPAVEAQAPAAPQRVEAAPEAEEPPPPDPPTPRPSPDRLDVVLRRWHAALDRVQTATCQLTRTDKDEDAGKVEVASAAFRYLKANDSWELDRRKKRGAEEADRIISHKKEMYWYFPHVKEVWKMQKPLGWPLAEMASDPSWALLGGMTPAAAKEQFDWKLVKEDKWYIYLAIEPRNKQDREKYPAARLVLLRDSYLPRQLWLQTPNGDVTWDIAKLDTTVALTKADFEPKVPAGWRLADLALKPLAEADLPGGSGRLDLGTVKVGDVVKRRFMLRGVKPFCLTDLEGPAEATLAPDPDAKPKKVHTVTLEYQPVRPGPILCAVKIKTDLEGAEVTVILEGVAKP
jgi:RNA polymerase sigma factor (sigma-70 family)